MLTAQVDMSYKDGHVFNIVVTPLVEEDSYAVFNARLTYVSPNDKYETSFFIKNLTDQEYRRYAFDTSAYFGATEDVWGEPKWAHFGSPQTSSVAPKYAEVSNAYLLYS